MNGSRLMGASEGNFVSLLNTSRSSPVLRRAVVVLLSASALLSWIVVTPLPASATINCLSSYKSYFAGILTNASDSSGHTFEGTRADIENNDNPICDTGLQNSDNFWYDWVMIAPGPPSLSDRGHVQVGYFRYWGSCIYFATEWQKNNGSSASFTRHIKTGYGCRTETGSTLFTVKYNPSTGYEDMLEGSTNLGTSPFSIYSAWSTSTNFVPELSGESKYIGTDIPGTPTDPTAVTNIQLQKFDDSWSSLSASLPAFSDICPWPVRYFRTSVSSHAFYFDSESTTSTSLTC